MMRLKNFMQSVVDSVKKVKTFLTSKIFYSYILISIPLVVLIAILFDIFLYVFDPAHLPEPIVKLGTLAWTVILGSVGLVGLLARKQLPHYFKLYYTYIQNSLPTRHLLFAVLIASLITASLVPYIQYSAPPRTAIPYTAYSGTVFINDPLTSNRLGWVTDQAEQKSCKFTNSGYEVYADNINKPQACFANKTQHLTDFALQIEMTLEKGIVGGILFRDSYLLILIGNSFTTGSFNLYAYIRNGNRMTLTPECDPIATGCPIGESFASQQTVTVTIIARGASLELYVDSHKLQVLTSEVSSTGRIGVFAETAQGQQDAQTKVLFANMRIWTNIA